MRFRHVAMHSYDHFDFGRARTAIAAAVRFVARIDDDLAVSQHDRS